MIQGRQVSQSRQAGLHRFIDRSAFHAYSLHNPERPALHDKEDKTAITLIRKRKAEIKADTAARCPRSPVGLAALLQLPAQGANLLLQLLLALPTKLGLNASTLV